MNVLLIDDEIPRNEDLVHLIELIGRHRVTQCISPLEALDYFQANIDSIDVVILDMMFPMDVWVRRHTNDGGHDTGVHLLKEILRIKGDNTRKITIHIVSARTDLPHLLRRFDESNISSVIEKPINGLDLLNEIHIAHGLPTIDFNLFYSND